MESTEQTPERAFAEAQELAETFASLLEVTPQRHGPEDNPYWHLPTVVAQRVFDIVIDATATVRVDGTVLATDIALASARAIAAQKQ